MKKLSFLLLDKEIIKLYFIGNKRDVTLYIYNLAPSGMGDREVTFKYKKIMS